MIINPLYLHNHILVEVYLVYIFSPYHALTGLFSSFFTPYFTIRHTNPGERFKLYAAAELSLSLSA